MNQLLAILNHHPELKERLAVLGMFQDHVNTRLLASFCAQPAIPHPLQKLDAKQWDTTLQLLQDEGLLERLNSEIFTLPPATLSISQHLLQERMAGLLVIFEKALANTYSRLALEVNRDYEAYPEQAAPLLRREEENFMHALDLALRHALWRQAEDLVTAIEKLFTPAAHWKEWQWTLRRVEQNLAAAPEPPTNYALWELLTQFRLSVPDHVRDFDGEEKHLLQLRTHFANTGDDTGQVRTLRQLARIATARDLHPAGEEYYRECLSHSTQLKNDTLHCTVLNDLARSLLRQKQPESAHQVLQEGLSIARELPDKETERETLSLLDETARALGDWKSAEGYCRELLRNAESSGQDSTVASSLERLGRLALEQHLAVDAEGYFLRCRELWQSLKDEKGEAAALTGLGDASLLRQETDPARARFNESLWLHTRLGNRPGQASVLARLGTIELEAHELEKAGAHFFKCEQLLGTIHDPQLEAIILTGLARISYCREAYTTAQNFYQQTLAIHEQLGSIAEIADVLYNLGLVAERLNDLPRARKRHERSLAFAARAGKETQQIRALLQLASIALQQGQFQEAQRRCLEGLPLAQHQNAVNDVAEIHYRLGRIAVQLCRPQEAQSHYLQALQLPGTTHCLEWHLKVLGHLAALPELARTDLIIHFRNALALAEQGGSEATRLKLLYKLAELSEADHQWFDAEYWLRRCLSLEQELSSTAPQAQLLQKIGLLLDQQGRPQEAISLFQRSIDLNGFPSGEHPYHTRVMLRLADFALSQGQPEDALIHYQHCLKIGRDLGDVPSLVKSSLGLGRIALRRGDLDNTRNWLDQAIAACQSSSHLQDRAEVLVELGDLEKQCDRFKTAERHYQSALRIYEDLHSETAQASTWVRLAELADEQEDSPQALNRYERARALCQVLRDAPNLYRIRTAIQRLQKTLA